MYHSNSKKLPTPKELHEKYKVKFWVKHFHQGNDPTGKERDMYSNGKSTPAYVTTCEITNYDNTEELGYGVSVCSSKDVPNRRLGHEIAVSRAIKDFVERKSRINKDDTYSVQVY